MCACACVCARAHIYYIRHSISNATGMREYSGNPPCVSANIQRMQLSIPATGHLSACPPPSFFHIGTFHGKKTNWPAFISRSRWTLFFFFLWYMLPGRVCTWSVCVGCIIFEYCYHILQIFFFFPRKGKRDSFSRGKGKFSWRLVYGQFERRSRRYDENFIERRVV